jgi:hypothetical protein
MRRFCERLTIERFGLACVAGEISPFRSGGFVGGDDVAMEIFSAGICGADYDRNTD